MRTATLDKIAPRKVSAVRIGMAGDSVIVDRWFEMDVCSCPNSVSDRDTEKHHEKIRIIFRSINRF